MSISERFAITEKGSGTTPMIFIHGYGCDQNMWRLVTPHFEPNFRVILYDQIGAGNSDASAFVKSKYASLQGYADDLISICDALNLSGITVVGHSVSGMISLLAAKKRPELFEHLIMVGPSPCYLDDGAYQGGFTRESLEELLEFLEINHRGWSAQMAPVIMGNPDRPELALELESSFCRTDPEIAHHFARTTFLSDHRSDLDGVATPTLILQCDEDAIAPLTVGEYMQATMPNAQLALIHSEGHCPHISAPDLVAETIRNYLRAEP
ncbi:alpha/beta fold hydrolase [Asticcacaulis biprosthecium]|uniref:alpha/beta fold hydrolase n=1 Tax=Asticcacaulis biprosthecium TaxID=76891 RepID=UPI00031E7297|nr:alpha/beta hydrolase [Asticcacaulis biprosthecium]